SGSAPYRRSLRQTSTRSLARFVGRLNISRSHAGAACCSDTLIAIYVISIAETVATRGVADGTRNRGRRQNLQGARQKRLVDEGRFGHVFRRSQGGSEVASRRWLCQRTITNPFLSPGTAAVVLRPFHSSRYTAAHPYESSGRARRCSVLYFVRGGMSRAKPVWPTCRLRDASGAGSQARWL